MGFHFVISKSFKLLLDLVVHASLELLEVELFLGFFKPQLVLDLLLVPEDSILEAKEESESVEVDSCVSVEISPNVPKFEVDLLDILLNNRNRLSEVL